MGTGNKIPHDQSPKKLVDSTDLPPYTPKNLGDMNDMARSKSEHLTPLELEIMHVLSGDRSGERSDRAAKT